MYCLVFLESTLFRVVGIGDRTETNNVRLVRMEQFDGWVKDPSSATVYGANMDKLLVADCEATVKVLFGT